MTTGPVTTPSTTPTSAADPFAYPQFTQAFAENISTMALNLSQTGLDLLKDELNDDDQ